MGITRLANVTGLDRIGIPVVMAVRPNSRSLSVAQGKGVDLAAAKASALMEAAETFHAENATPAIPRASLHGIESPSNPLDWERLPRLDGREFSRQTQIAWSEGRTLPGNAPIWIPFDLVHTDFRASGAVRRTVFPLGSNGLASGNSLPEATCAAIAELIERDAMTLWSHRSSEEKARRRVDLATVDNHLCRALLDSLAEREMAVKVWDLTSDIGVATFLCQLEDAPGGSGPRLSAFHGSGAHLAREVALVRAITEAAQTRLTYIAGSRDDLQRSNYMERADARILETLLSAWETRFPARSFADVPDLASESFGGDIETLLAKLRRAGLPQVVAVDLTRPDFDLPVVRVVVPGLEFIDEDPRYLPGERARRVAAGQE